MTSPRVTKHYNIISTLHKQCAIEIDLISYLYIYIYIITAKLLSLSSLPLLLLLLLLRRGWRTSVLFIPHVTRVVVVNYYMYLYIYIMYINIIRGRSSNIAVITYNIIIIIILLAIRIYARDAAGPSKPYRLQRSIELLCIICVYVMQCDGDDAYSIYIGIIRITILYLVYYHVRINKVIDNVCCFFFRYQRRIRIFCFSNALNSPRKLVSNKVLFLCKSFCCVNSSAVVCIKLDDSIWTLICTKIVKIKKKKQRYLISKIKIKKNILTTWSVISKT